MTVTTAVAGQVKHTRTTVEQPYLSLSSSSRISLSLSPPTAHPLHLYPPSGGYLGSQQQLECDFSFNRAKGGRVRLGPSDPVKLYFQCQLNLESGRFSFQSHRRKRRQSRRDLCRRGRLRRRHAESSGPGPLWSKSGPGRDCRAPCIIIIIIIIII